VVDAGVRDVEEKSVSALYLIALVAALVVFGYLVVALFFPEKFS
jgi:hypothetical protein